MHFEISSAFLHRMLSNIRWVRGVWLSFFPLRLLSSHGTLRQWGWYTARSSGDTLSRKSQGDSSVKSLLLTGNAIGKLTCFLKSSGVYEWKLLFRWEESVCHKGFISVTMRGLSQMSSYTIVCGLLHLLVCYCGNLPYILWQKTGMCSVN